MNRAADRWRVGRFYAAERSVHVICLFIALLPSRTVANQNSYAFKRTGKPLLRRACFSAACSPEIPAEERKRGIALENERVFIPEKLRLVRSGNGREGIKLQQTSADANVLSGIFPSFGTPHFSSATEVGISGQKVPSVGGKCRLAFRKSFSFFSGVSAPSSSFRRSRSNIYSRIPLLHVCRKNIREITFFIFPGVRGGGGGKIWRESP